jgi:hypothetical protein
MKFSDNVRHQQAVMPLHMHTYVHIFEHSHLNLIQGDQMSLLKSRPKCSPTHFCVLLLLKKGNYFCNFLKTAQSKLSPNERHYWAKIRKFQVQDRSAVHLTPTVVHLSMF